jgi:hypothetical protein
VFGVATAVFVWSPLPWIEIYLALLLVQLCKEKKGRCCLPSLVVINHEFVCHLSPAGTKILVLAVVANVS